MAGPDPSTDQIPRPDAAYLLNHVQSQTDEQDRLNNQHFYLRSMINNNQLFPPEVMQSGPASNDYLPTAVADIACGTGIFLNEIAKENYTNNPKVKTPPRLIGFDATDKFPAHREPGVEFVLHDCQTPFPKEYWGTFDAVNIRLIWAAIKKDALVGFLSNAVQLLRPGGYLQWVEGDPAEIELEPAFPTVTKVIEYVAKERKARGLMTRLTTQMLQTLLDVTNNKHDKFEILRYEVVKATPETKKQVNEQTKASVMIMVFRALIFLAEGLVQRLENENGNGNQNQEELDDIKGAVSELREAMKTPEKWDVDTPACVVLARVQV